VRVDRIRTVANRELASGKHFGAVGVAVTTGGADALSSADGLGEKSSSSTVNLKVQVLATLGRIEFA
jgi:hypothetical protein